MISDKKEKPRMLAAAEEVGKISRSMLVWANTFPEKPVDIIKYEFRRPPHGGAWIEITRRCTHKPRTTGRPPHGGRGLK